MQPAKKMLNLLGTKKRFPLDSDGDGHANVMDCQPYNKNKQGWLHDKVEAYKEKAAEKREVKAIEHTAYIEARKKEASKFGEQRASAEREHKLKQYKQRQSSGGIVSQFASGFSRGTPRRTSQTTAKYRYVKKGTKARKGYKRVRVSQPKPTRRPSLSEHMSSIRFEP